MSTLELLGGEGMVSGAFVVSGPNVVVAFSHALNAVENVAKTQTADTGKYTYRYADLGDVLDEVKRACLMHGLSVFQCPTYTDDKLEVVTALIHESGEWMSFPPMGLRLPNDAQAVGSALTYARRYSLLTIFGIAPEDDDGQAATHAARAPAQNQGYRTPAEQMVYAELAMLEPDPKKRLIEDFRRKLGMGMSDLPPNRHGEALTFVREWLDQEEQQRQINEAAKGDDTPEEPY